MFGREVVLGTVQVKEVLGGNLRCGNLIDLLGEKLEAVAAGELNSEDIDNFLARLPEEVSEKLTSNTVLLRGDSIMGTLRKEAERKKKRKKLFN